MKIFAVFLFCISNLLIAQDSTHTFNPYQRRQDGWNNYKTSLRFGLGLQRSVYTEIGVARHKYNIGCTGYASSLYYAALEWLPTIRAENEKNIYALKAGYEVNGSIIALGLEAKYQSDLKKNDIVLTPKIGFGIYGMINIFYGYNISFNHSPFSRVGHHQFSLVVNLNKRIINDIW
jgi:hypothetical protein